MILDLSTGIRWKFETVGRRAEHLLLRLSDVMQVAGTGQGAEARALHSCVVSYEGRCLTVTTKATPDRFLLLSKMRFPLESCPDLSLCGTDSKGRIFRDLVALSLVIGAQAQSRGGVLVHGAFAEREGKGVLLLGPSGRGKTTASRRLPPAWRSLSDDMALVIPRQAGVWSVHPWPTWSSFRDGDGGSWDVQRGVGLAGMLFLVRAAADSVERIGPGRATCFLMESFEQAWSNWRAFFPAGTMKFLRRTAFENIASLAGLVPAFLLHIGPDGAFWEKIEEALGEVRGSG